MVRTRLLVAFVALSVITLSLLAQNQQTNNFVSVTDEILKNPSPNDWLMFSRTYDAQRFSPLKQINKQNVGQLRVAWMKEMGDSGSQESIPLVYRGVIYTFHPGAIVQALDATNGNLIWEYRRAGRQFENEGTRHLRRHGLFHDARWRHRGARRERRQSEMGSQGG
jgi:alcohol dehydrogenase (cytochrome c)